jgi:hypothetical protein
MAPPLLLQLPIIALLVLGLVGCGSGSGGESDECPPVLLPYGVCFLGGVGDGPDSPPTAPPPSPRASVLAADEGIYVIWDANRQANYPASSYNIYYASSSGVTKTNYSALPGGQKITGATSPQIITGRNLGNDYYLVVTSVNEAGESEGSLELKIPKIPDTTPTHFISAQTLSPWMNGSYSSETELNNPQISVNSSGDAVVSWEDDWEHQVYAANFRDAAGWSSATRIGKTNYYERYPKVSIDQYGNALAIWARGSGGLYPEGCDRSLAYGHHCLVNSIYRPELGWSDPFVIPMADMAVPHSLRLVMDRQGNALVYSVEYINQDNVHTVLGYDPVSGWSQISEVIRDQNPTHMYLISDNNGGAIAVWQAWPDWPNNNPKIFFSTFTWDSEWTTLVELGDGEDVNVRGYLDPEPQLALSSNGNMVVAWTKKISGDSYNQVMANYFSPSTGWSGQTNIGDRAGDASFASVGIGASGNAMVIWRQDNGTNDVVRAKNYIPGLGWGQAYDIGGDFPGDSGEPLLVMSDAGNATAVWTQIDSNTNSIVGNKYNAAMGWSGPELISLDYIYGRGALRIGVGKDDKALVAWEQYIDSNHRRIKAGMY